MSSDGASGVLGRILAADVDEAVLRALATRQQRYALYYMLDHERATLGELADVLSGWQAVTDRTVTTAADHSSLRIGLYHTHLPRLDDAGLVAFDPTERVVDRAPLSADQRELIEAARAAERWSAEPTAR